MREQINQLKEERAGLIEEMRTEILRIESEGRNPEAEEQEKLERMEADIDSIGKRAERLEKLAGFDSDTASGRRESGDSDSPDKEEVRVSPATLREFNEQRAREARKLVHDTPEYREAFFRWFTTPNLADVSPDDFRELAKVGHEWRALSKATGAAGGNLVPAAFYEVLIEALRDFGVTREIANVITTDNGEALTLPSEASHGVITWTAENAAYSASDEAFGTATLNAYKGTTLMLVSEELLTDSFFDLESYVKRQFGMRFGVGENTAYVVGDGTGKPTGYQPNVTVGIQAATGNTTTIPADNLIDLQHSLQAAYRRNAVFVMNDATVKAVRKIKDTTNQYLWAPGLVAGQQDTILGHKVYTDPDMPVPGASVKSIVFGDFQQGYTIRDVNGVFFQRLSEAYAANGQVGFRMYHRTDGKITNAAALRAFQNSAT